MNESIDLPSGWYTDPEGSGQERFWNGNSWTNAYRPVDTPVQRNLGTPTQFAEPKKKKGCGWFIWWIVAFGIGFIIFNSCMNAILNQQESTSSSSGTTSNSAARPPSKPSPTVEETAPIYGIGDYARDGQFQFVVKKVKCGRETVGGEYIYETAQGQYCVVTMDIKNIGDKPQSFYVSNQKGTTNRGLTVEADSYASLLLNEDGSREDINPGNSIKDYKVVYDIAENQNLASVELHDSIFSFGVTVNLK